MDIPSVLDQPEPSWSETTTPASEDIEEIVRQTPPPRPRIGSRPRFMRPIRRRKPNKSSSENNLERITQTSFTLQTMEFVRSREGSNASSSSAMTIVTSATSTCTDPWSSSSGYVEEEEDNDDGEWDKDDEIMEDLEELPEDREVPITEGRSSGMVVDSWVVPKLEPGDDAVNMADVKDIIIAETPPSSQSSLPTKRPRGRPRKHPKISPEDKSKIIKNRSKTGCITCRRRKKKCDERKPECLNCEKNGSICEGYPERQMWQSGREKAAEGIFHTSQQVAEELIASPACLRRVSLNIKPLASIIPGVDGPSDRLFFEHYCSRLSIIFTLEGEENNPFKNILLPMAIEHPGLMHSILSLASKHIDYNSPYTMKFLEKHPKETIETLRSRTQYHDDEASAQFHKDLTNQSANSPLPPTPAAILAQILCLTLQTLSDPNPSGQHRFHLEHYLRIVHSSPPEASDAVKLIDEIMQYHIYTDELICLPENRGYLNIGTATDEWDIPPTCLQPDAIRLLGVFDGLFFYMSKITNMRNKIRTRMQAGMYEVTNYKLLDCITEIDVGIRSWQPAWQPGDSRDRAGELYRRMLWVYLYRTVYPPQHTGWKINPKLTDAVNGGIAILGTFGPRDPSQTLVLAPAFVLGCAAFEKEQREEIRKAIRVVKAYMEYKNSDTALEVLEEVWRLMDAKDERSWDWQTIAHGMGMDFLAT